MGELMRACGCLLGLLLIPLGIAVFVFFNVMPAVIIIDDASPIKTILQAALCGVDEVVIIEYEPHTDLSEPDTTLYLVNYFCGESERSQVRRDVNGRADMISYGTSFVLLVLGIGLILLALRGQNTPLPTLRGQDTDLRGARSEPWAMPTHSAPPPEVVITPISGKALDPALSERLREALEAYEKGFLTQDEFERKRRQIIDET